jgi:hypothetical protein
VSVPFADGAGSQSYTMSTEEDAEDYTAAADAAPADTSAAEMDHALFLAGKPGATAPFAANGAEEAAAAAVSED